MYKILEPKIFGVDGKVIRGSRKSIYFSSKLQNHEKKNKSSFSIYTVKHYQIELVPFLVTENYHLWVLPKRNFMWEIGYVFVTY